MTQWKGKTNANVNGIKFFVFTLKTFGVGVAYLILPFVAFYYYVFDFKSKKSNEFYFENVLKFKGLKKQFQIFNRYHVFGKTLVDKVAILSNSKHNYTIDHDGVSHLKQLIKEGKGGILVSAHMGNWEIAGQLLNGLDTSFNVLMYENEKLQVKTFLDKVQKGKNYKTILIKEGSMNHVIELNNVFKNNEFVVMHGDRFREGAPIIDQDFMGHEAIFPKGPFLLASKFGVPISFVFSMKESKYHYHFFATKPIVSSRCRSEEELEKNISTLSSQYAIELEQKVRRYPSQWFNFYDFWKNTNVN